MNPSEIADVLDRLQFPAGCTANDIKNLTTYLEQQGLTEKEPQNEPRYRHIVKHVGR